MTQTWLSYRVALPAPAPRAAVERFGSDVRAALGRALADSNVLVEGGRFPALRVELLVGLIDERFADVVETLVRRTAARDLGDVTVA